MGLVVLGLVLFGLVTVAAGVQAHTLLVIFAIVYGVYVVGFIMVLSGLTRIGAKIIIVSSIIYIPIGLIGILGGRKLLDELAKQEFYKQQEAAENA